MLAYCDNRSSLSEPWISDGLSPCFMETITGSLLFFIIAVFGGIQICIYRRFSNVVEHRSALPRPCLYILQVILTLSMAAEAATRLTLKSKVIGFKALYGYNILNCTCMMLAWPLTLIVIQLERKRMLPSIPTRGHGLVLLLFWTLAFAVENFAFISWLSPLYWWQNRDFTKNVELGLWCWRYCVTGLLFLIGFVAPGIPSPEPLSIRADEEEALLSTSQQSVQADSVIRASTGSAWKGIWRKSKLLWPYMWPKKHYGLQLCVITCMLLLVAGRIVNLYNPIMYKLIVDSMTIKNTTNHTVYFESGEKGYLVTAGGLQFRWDYILIYVGLRFLQGGGFGSMGLLNNLRTFLWIWIQQYSTREIEVTLFAHLHGLSLRWHLGRKTGEVLRVMDRGTSSINNLLNYVVFNILPTIADIVIAIVYFLTSFNAWFALIITITMALYLFATIAVTEWRTKFRREMNILDNDRNAKGVDSLLNFETVKYYGAESFEVERYREAILKF